MKERRRRKRWTTAVAGHGSRSSLVGSGIGWVVADGRRWKKTEIMGNSIEGMREGRVCE